jgi:hypothetical protein
MTVGHDANFLAENLTGTATLTAFALLGYTAETEYVCPFNLCIARIKLILTEARTAGTFLLTVYKNGVAIAYPAPYSPISAANPQAHDLVIDQSQATQFLLGDRLKVLYTTVGWTPTTSDAIAILSLARPYGP